MIERLLAKKPGDRLQSADEVIAALGQGARPSPTEHAEPHQRGIPTNAVFMDQAGLTSWCEAAPDAYPPRGA